MDELDRYFEHDTRAAEWHELRIALTGRLKALRRELDAAPPEERARLGREVEALEKQIETLLVEEVAQKFVEDSVKYTIAANYLEDELKRSEEDGE